jgi:NADP-dependent 3-hydroxy acid dehydrogenase YdfG
MEPLHGKVAWTTGAGTGIGRACAVAYARAGAPVALTGRWLSPLEETAVRTDAPAGEVVIAPADVSDAGAVATAHAKIVAALGDSLVLVNSAGGNVKQRHWGNLAPACVSEVIDLDLEAMFYCTLAALPVMRARGDGRIVHIASQAGVSLTPITGPSYMAAKHPVAALSRSLNAEEAIHGHPPHLSLAGRGGDADPQHAAGAADRRGARVDAPARGRRRGRALLRDAAAPRLRHRNSFSSPPTTASSAARPTPSRRWSARLCLRHSQNPSGQIEGPR